MTGQEPTEAIPSRHRWLWVTAGLVLLLLTVGLIVLWVQAPNLYRGDVGEAQATATTRGGILTVAAALIAAAAAGSGLYFTARTLAETQRANRAADQRDRYAKAIEHLGSKN